MLKLISFLLFLSVAFTHASHAARIFEGIGIAATAEDARSNAMSDLASSLHAEVFSQITICQQDSKTKPTDCGSKSVVSTRSDLPLLGVDFTHLKSGDSQHEVLATLNPLEVKKLYTTELSNLHDSITKNSRRLSKKSNQSDKLALLGELLTQTTRYEKLRLVASLLGETGFQTTTPTRAELSAQLQNAQSHAESFTLAAKFISDAIIRDSQKVFIFPPRQRGTREITPFARAIRDHLNRHIQSSVNRPDQANHVLRGEYEILDNGDVHLIYGLRNPTGEDIRSHAIRIDKKAYQGYRAKATAPDFEQLLSENIVVSSEFRGDILTNQGSDDLLFNAGDTLKLMVRLNKPGYFFIIGHIVQQDQKFSYLVELNEGSGAGKFVQYVPADHANRYIELGEFEVEAPFGVEHLQLIASNHDLAAKLPGYRYDDRSGYYVVEGSRDNNKLALLKTRGLKSKALKNNALAIAEATLTLTTMK